MSIFETNQGVTLFKRPKKELINWFLLFARPIHHRSVMLMSYVIQSCNIRAIGYEVESTPKIEFLYRAVSYFVATYHAKNRVLVTASWMLHQTSLNEFKTPTTKSNFIHSSFRFVKSGATRWICICICFCIEIFTMDQTNFVSATWKFSFFLSFWSSFFWFLHI